MFSRGSVIRGTRTSVTAFAILAAREESATHALACFAMPCSRQREALTNVAMRERQVEFFPGLCSFYSALLTLTAFAYV